MTTVSLDQATAPARVPDLASPCVPAGAVRYRRSRRVFWRSTARGLLVLGETGDPLAVIGAGVDLWGLLVDPATEDELCTGLARRFRMPLDEVRPLVRPVLQRLMAVGAVDAS
jgi:hypothetical protein